MAEPRLVPVEPDRTVVREFVRLIGPDQWDELCRDLNADPAGIAEAAALALRDLEPKAFDD